MENSVNTHNRLRYFLTNKIFILQVMYRDVHRIFIVKCVTITLFFIAYATLWWKSVIFIVLSSLETVQYRYCIFSLLYILLRIRLKVQNPLLSYVREREYTVNIQCSVQYTLLLLPYLMFIWKQNNFHHWGDPGVDKRIILRRIFRKWEGVVGTGWSWLRIRRGGGHLWVR
jgi:hypothetical protein